jgi:hypothetical protein
MRFSMKWVLLGMAYVAVAAAAFSQGHWVYADLLWLSTFLAICYAVLTAATSNGVKRAIAAGFAIFALAFALCAQFADGTTPTRRLLLAAGVEEWTSFPPQISSPSTSSPWTLQVTSNGQSYGQPYYPDYPVPAANASVALGAIAAQPTLTAVVAPPIEMPFISKLRAANAVGAMLLGLIGGCLAAAAFRRHRTAGDGSAA